MNTMTKLPIEKSSLRTSNEFLKPLSVTYAKKKQSVVNSQQISKIPIMPPLKLPRTELPSSPSLKKISDFIQEFSSSVLSNSQHLTSIDWTKNFKLSFKSQSILISPLEFLSGILKSFFKNDSAHKLAFFLFQHFLLKTHSQNESTPTSLDFSETFSTFTSNQIKETSYLTRLLQTQAAQDQTSTTILSDKPINSTILNPTLSPSASSHNQAITIDMNLVVNALLALAIAACVLIPLVLAIVRVCYPPHVNTNPQASDIENVAPVENTSLSHTEGRSPDQVEDSEGISRDIARQDDLIHPSESVKDRSSKSCFLGRSIKQDNKPSSDTESKAQEASQVSNVNIHSSSPQAEIEPQPSSPENSAIVPTSAHPSPDKDLKEDQVPQAQDYHELGASRSESNDSI